MTYIDTNVFGYAIEDHPKYGKSCKRILTDVADGRLDASCSVLVLVELIGVLKKLNNILSRRGLKELNIKDNIDAVLSLPIGWVDLDLLIVEIASTYRFKVNGVDYVHLATMEANSIQEILSADKDLDKAKIVSRTDPLLYKRGW